MVHKDDVLGEDLCGLIWAWAVCQKDFFFFLFFVFCFLFFVFCFLFFVFCFLFFVFCCLFLVFVFLFESLCFYSFNISKKLIFHNRTRHFRERERRQYIIEK